MIQIQNITKKFDALIALHEVSAEILEGHVFGLIGTNGAGKSTLLRTICGVFQPDEGCVLIDEAPVYNNPEAKAKLMYLSDDPYFSQSGTPADLARRFAAFYPSFDREKFNKLMTALKLDSGRRIHTFSKGMKKQLQVVCGLSSNVKYLLLDETFDGLDPVMRQTIKRLFVLEMENRSLTPIIASHNLRELEDICEHVGLLHEGGILFSKDLDALKLGIFKLQCVLKEPAQLADIRERFPILTSQQHGSLYTLTLRGSSEDADALRESLQPVFWELLPLTLEEIFISETEVLGYDFNDL